MSLAQVFTRASVGIDAPSIQVEVHLANGLPAFNIVGLPEASVREARDRVRSALTNSGFEFPAKRITVNLAPADLPKEGGRFDLPIAIGIISAAGLLPQSYLSNVELVGELALSGELRPVSGVLPFAYACHRSHKAMLVPSENDQEAMLIRDAKVYGAVSLLEAFHHLSGQKPLELTPSQPPKTGDSASLDMQDIVGQAMAKQALEIAAAGNHNLLFFGPPGTGKTMLANRLISLLPDLSEEQALEKATVHSVCGHSITPDNFLERPFRHPHHSSSAVALVGGGSIPRPGEISLAHQGVLFLDELAEFDRKVIDALREPLESGSVSISRAARQAQFPAQFQLVAAMNPSPTGEVGDGRSSPEQIRRYLSKVSGPFLDRIDLQVEVPRIPASSLHQDIRARGEDTQTIRARVLKAREIQLQRAEKLNQALTNKELESFCALSNSDQGFIETAINRLNLSLRSYHRVLRIARTLADLQDIPQVERPHLAQALGYRALDKLLSQLAE